MGRGARTPGYNDELGPFLVDNFGPLLVKSVTSNGTLLFQLLEALDLPAVSFIKYIT